MGAGAEATDFGSKRIQPAPSGASSTAVIGQPRVSPVDRLVSDTGILTAVLLAPLGAG